jgi:carbon-monoxide dehydrogenase medium subunit
LLRYEHLIDVKTIPGLSNVEVKDSEVHIGAAVTHRMIERSTLIKTHLPVFANMEAQVANVRVRATGTLGGNLCFAEPHSDPATLLLALEGKTLVQGKAGERVLPVDELLVGPYETSLVQDDVMVGIRIPILKSNQRAAYLKFQIHERPLLGLALVLQLNDNLQEIRAARVAAGCVSPRPCRSAEAEELLMGPVDAARQRLRRAANALADRAELVDDLEGSAEYKRHLIGVLLKRAWNQALS